MTALAFDNTPAHPDDYLPGRPGPSLPPSPPPPPPAAGLDVEAILAYVAAKGYTFEPWQIAAFVTAARTKPFVILAGISGTGKTRLPQLIAEATEATCHVIPVKPDWADSSDLVGFDNIAGIFQAGELLKLAKDALDHPEQQYFVVLDEMNIARVEYYLAEVLSTVENRRRDGDRYIAPPLNPATTNTDWNTVYLPDNICIVGSVNMDETTFGFSKKVLDRAFVLEFMEVDLSDVGGGDGTLAPTSNRIDAAAWRPKALLLSEHPNRTDTLVSDSIGVLTTLNDLLGAAQLQIGYRVRDEIAMFCLAAAVSIDTFRTKDSGLLDPLDLAIAMKLLPRIQGSSQSIRKLLKGLLAWAEPSEGGGASGTLTTRSFPFCRRRIDMMLTRLDETGFASYWL